MILVTGATGTNGRLVVQLLRHAGAAVRAMVQSTPKAADLADAGAQVVAGLRPTGDSAGRALEGVERCLLLRRSTSDSCSAKRALLRPRRRRASVTW
jgi:uncharacterized protein YbjT (DUF2867 family)